MSPPPERHYQSCPAAMEKERGKEGTKTGWKKLLSLSFFPGKPCLPACARTRLRPVDVWTVEHSGLGCSVRRRNKWPPSSSSVLLSPLVPSFFPSILCSFCGVKSNSLLNAKSLRVSRLPPPHRLRHASSFPSPMVLPSASMSRIVQSPFYGMVEINRKG